MPLTCRACRRLNPPEAAYCHFDGVPLEGHSPAGREGPPGTRPFPMPLMLPSGRVCGNFSELALACWDDWAGALELLRDGHLATFLSSLGRADLAVAAREAARSPAPDRGFDEFLGRLPGDALAPAKLVVGLSEIDLGTLAIGTTRRFSLPLRNAGSRLLWGSVAVEDAPWLAVGETSPSATKVFQFRGETAVVLHVLGQCLRAGARPLEGRLVIESNGGSAALPVRATVPVRPFPDGALAGARTPRQLAELAKAAPREATLLFESGAVQRWYQDNGWVYPVQGPAGSGLGAVQQFFEALGLVRPPRVTLPQRLLVLRGRPGEALQHFFVVETEEKRPVFASAVSDQPWLKVGRARIAGRVATIPVSVPSVPDRPGETLTATLSVTANGNQRFELPLTLTVTFPGAGPPVLSLAEAVAEPAGWPTRSQPPDEVPVLSLAEAVAGPAEVVGEPEVLSLAEAVAPPAPPAPGAGARRRGGLFRHLFPLGGLLLVFLGLFVRDLFVPAEAPLAPEPFEPPPVVEVDPTPQIACHFHDGPKKGDEDDPELRRPTMRFGLVMLTDKDDEGQPKKLTFDQWGRTNNTCLRLDGREVLFGDDRAGRWEEREARRWRDEGGGEHEGMQSVWSAAGGRVRVTQTVEVVPGEVTPGPTGRLVRYRDTCLVRYRLENECRLVAVRHPRRAGEPPRGLADLCDVRLENRGADGHEVGLRFLLDTFIGANDGVPFVIPGEPGLCDTCKEFDGPRRVPGYIQAQELDRLKNPGTVAHVQFRLGGPIEPPDRVTLGAWPDERLGEWLKERRARGPLTGWDVPVLPIRTVSEEAARRPGQRANPDSAVAIYWAPRRLGPGEKREVGFAYGLGKVSAPQEDGGNFLLTGDAGAVEGRSFTVQAVVSRPTPGQTLTLTLPAGLELVGGSAAQAVPPVAASAARPSSTVTWQVRAPREGVYRVAVKSSTGGAQKHPVRVGRKSGIFGSN
jgi:hypothetical protein